MSGAPSKEVGQIFRELRRLGYREERLASGHFAVRDPEGKRLRTRKGGYISIAATPSGDPRAIENIKAALRRAGVPLGSQENGKADSEARNRTASLEAAREQRKARAHVLREQLKQLMVEHSLRQTDVYHWGEHYCKQHGIATPAGPQAQLSNFLRGASLMPESEAYMEATIQSIRAAQGKIPKAEEIRQRETGVEPEALPEGESVPDDGKARNKPEHVQARSEDQSPSESARVVLALRVMQAIYKPEKDDEAIEALCKEVAGLEPA